MPLTSPYDAGRSGIQPPQSQLRQGGFSPPGVPPQSSLGRQAIPCPYRPCGKQWIYCNQPLSGGTYSGWVQVQSVCIDGRCVASCTLPAPSTNQDKNCYHVEKTGDTPNRRVVVDCKDPWCNEGPCENRQTQRSICDITPLRSCPPQIERMSVHTQCRDGKTTVVSAQERFGNGYRTSFYHVDNACASLARG